MAHGFSSGFRHAGVWVSYRTTVRQFGNFLLHNDSSWWGPAALSKATRNVLRSQARGWSLWGWLSGLPWLPSPRLRHGAASTSGCFVQVKGAGGDAVGIWREGLPVHGSQVPQRGVKSHCNSQVQSGAVGYAAHRVCSP